MRRGLIALGLGVDRLSRERPLLRLPESGDFGQKMIYEALIWWWFQWKHAPIEGVCSLSGIW
jgi:hypothetical protein